MMHSEFLQHGAKGQVSAEAFDKIEEVYCAYECFNSKKAIVDFWNKHGEAGIDTMMEPLNEYSKLKKEQSLINEEIATLQKHIATLQKKALQKSDKMKAIQLQCNLSWHWAQYAN